MDVLWCFIEREITWKAKKAENQTSARCSPGQNQNPKKENLLPLALLTRELTHTGVASAMDM